MGKLFYLTLLIVLSAQAIHAIRSAKNVRNNAWPGSAFRKSAPTPPSTVLPDLSPNSGQFPSYFIPKVLALATDMSSTENTLNSPATDEVDTESTTPSTTSSTSSGNDIEGNSTVSPVSSPPPPSSSSTTEEVTASPTPSEPPSTTTEMPPELPGQGVSTKSFFCLCDLQIQSCDINCCCDPDCLEEDKKLFTHCDTSLIYDPKSKLDFNGERSCFKSFTMYHVNSPYRVDRTEKGLFCVVKENVKQEREFSKSDMDKITNRVLQGKIKLRPKYRWDTSMGKFSEKQYFKWKKREAYRYGSVIWAVKSPENSYDEAQIIRLPAPFYSDTCSIHEPIKFLQDSFSSCVLPVSDVARECETLASLNLYHFIKSNNVIKNPSRSQKDNDTGAVYTEIMIKEACYNDEPCWSVADVLISVDDQNEIPNLKPGFDPDHNRCVNVLSRLNLTFVHSGIKGITHVVANVELQDVYVGAKEVPQEFQVDFIWSGEVKEQSENGTNVGNSTTVSDFPSPNDLKKLPRSGNPGYIVGKPIILGKKIIHKVKNESGDTKESVKTEQRIEVLHDTGQWLHIQGSGDCPEDSDQLHQFPRNSVLFGYDHVSTCKLRLAPFRHCEDLQRQIASAVFGKDDPKEFVKSKNVYVAAYGSPDAFPSDWVALNFVDIEMFLGGMTSSSSLLTNGCDGIITGIHVTIAYALVGPVEAPQAKITGVFYEPEESIQLPPTSQQQSHSPTSLVPSTRKKTKDNCGDHSIHELSITTTVTFVSVTSKPTSRVATWPVVSIRLPSDFFYPFSTSPAPSGASERKAICVWSLVNLSLFTVLFQFHLI